MFRRDVGKAEAFEQRRSDPSLFEAADAVASGMAILDDPGVVTRRISGFPRH